MPAIVGFPEVVEQALVVLSPLFQNKRQRHHLGEYLTGLYVAQRKTVNGINAEFASTTDQSCLNRWLTEASWDPTALNEMRLAELQKRHDTRYSKYGVIAIDDTLIDHTGKFIDDVGYLWDHAEQRSKIAHDLLIANYVATSGKHFPLEFRRFRKQEQCRPEGEGFKNHSQLFLELVDFCISRDIPGAFVFDSYFTNAECLNPLNAGSATMSATSSSTGRLSGMAARCPPTRWRRPFLSRTASWWRRMAKSNGISPAASASPGWTTKSK